MRNRLALCAVAAVAIASLPMLGCRSGPAVSDEASCPCPDKALAAEAHGELAAATQATGPEASTHQGRRGVALSPAVGVNRGQGDNNTVASSYDGSATVSAGAPAVVQTLLGSQANALLAGGGDANDPVFRAYSDSLRIVQARIAITTEAAEVLRLETREKELLASLERVTTERARAAVALAPSFPNLTTVVFSNASGSAAGTDKSPVDPANAAALERGLPALVREAKTKGAPAEATK